MNKYSSKAVKTAATVGMSLAMVLSNAAPVMAVNTTKVCTVKKQYNVGDIIASKEFKGTMTADAIKDAIAAEINALDKTKTEMVSGKTVEYYLGYINDSGSITKVTGAISRSDLTGSATATYGYYAANRYEIKNDESGIVTEIAKDAPLADSVVVTSVTVRDSDAVKAEVTSYAAGLKGSAVTWTGSAVDYTMPIIDENGSSATGTLTITYQIEGSGESTADPTFDTNKVTVYSKVKTSGFTDYTCKDVTTGEGLGITDRYTAKNVYNEIVSAFDKTSLTFENVKPGDEVEFTKTNTAALGKMAILSSDKKLNADFKAVLKELARYLDNTTDEGKAVERLLDMDTAMNDMFKADGNLAKAEKYDEDTEFKTTSAYATAADLLEDFNDFDTYLTNLKDADYDRVTEAKSVLEDLVNNYVAENDGDLLDTYLTNLDKFYEAFVDKNGDAGITKAQVDTAIKNIKNGTTFKDVKGKDVTIEKSDYTTFKENSGVEEYMTKFEDMYDAIEEVKDAEAKSNEAYKDLIKGDTSVKDFLTNKDSDRKLTAGKEFSSIKSNLTVEEYKILKAYKEEVLDAVLTLETKQVGNSYVNKSEKSIYATTAQLNTVLNNIGNGTDLDKGIFTKLDKEKGEFNWDKLVAHMEKVEASLEAVTTAIEKLDSISLTANDRAAILAADDAVYFLTDDGADNLTSAQARTVKNADRKVAELMEAYRMKFGSINAEVNGWVNKGNGDWAYYENGNAVTKWVASGSDWYYVRGGVMLRNSWIASDSQGTKWYYVDNAGKMVSNTTVNGYTFNSYGVWVK